MWLKSLCQFKCNRPLQSYIEGTLLIDPVAVDFHEGPSDPGL